MVNNHTRYNRVFLGSIGIIFTLSAIFALLRVGGSDNDVLLRYQIAKADYLKGKNRAVDLVIIGDSSSGNAIDAEYLSRVSGKNIENFALTGSFGFSGALYMMRKIHTDFGTDKFLLIYTPDIWHRKLEKGPIYKLLPFYDFADYASMTEGASYFGFFKYLLSPIHLVDAAILFYSALVDFISGDAALNLIEGDYLRQRKETYANGKKHNRTHVLETAFI